MTTPPKDAAALTVDGVPVGRVERPTSTEDVAQIMRAAQEDRQVVVPVGAATKLTWGAPPRRCDILLDTTGICDIVEHGEGEYIVIAGAGLRLSELQHRLAGSGQWLALDPSRDGTLGGILSTAHTGPVRLLYGGVRDLVIGATFVRADGVIARSGGKVVKNVAGYDLAKLLAGAYGTLAVVTQLAFRLHPIPAARHWVRVPVDSAQRAHELTQALIHSTIVPAALEVDWSDGRGELAVLLHGVPAGVASCASVAAGLMGSAAHDDDQAPTWWTTDPGGPGRTLVKVTHEIAAVARLLGLLDHLSQKHQIRVKARSSSGVGVTWVTVDDLPAAALADLICEMRAGATDLGGSAVLLDAAPEAKALIDQWGPVPAIDLMRRVKDQLDPVQLLSPGRFVGGI